MDELPPRERIRQQLQMDFGQSIGTLTLQGKLADKLIAIHHAQAAAGLNDEATLHALRERIGREHPGATPEDTAHYIDEAITEMLPAAQRDDYRRIIQFQYDIQTYMWQLAKPQMDGVPKEVLKEKIMEANLEKFLISDDGAAIGPAQAKGCVAKFRACVQASIDKALGLVLA